MTDFLKTQLIKSFKLKMVIYGWLQTTDWSGLTASGSSNTSVSYVLTGLSPNTLYHYRVLGQNGSGTGSFSSSIINLAEGTTYYLRAYAENNIGISYGQNVSFTSLGTFPEISITNPVNEEIISGTIKIIADSSLIADPVDFYIDNTLLGSGTISSVSD